ncbi:hypothetical protein [Undibacterium crateris]|uniref:hypothetical protein n=1 Tax=Undibacterium crateris TaxID=2528175 RepID=UPI00192F0522|nr:hypothetical protein [Undibacterium crateris]
MKDLMIRVAGLMLASGLACAPIAHATTAPAKSKAATKPAKAAKEPVAPEVKDEDDIVPDITTHRSLEYKCELGNSLTMYTNAEDPDHVALRWKKQLYRMKRIETSTGANRFENRKAGFVFIGIPSKGLLLDSRKGQQLANECKTTDPELAETAAATPAAGEVQSQVK